MPGLLQGLHSGVTEGDILACLPSKAETDILINIYFESVEASICVCIVQGILDLQKLTRLGQQSSRISLHFRNK